MALMLSQGSSSTKVVILDLEKLLVTYYLLIKLKKCIMSFYFTEQTVGSTEVFCTIGQKWRNWSESDRDAFKKVATNSKSPSFEMDFLV